MLPKISERKHLDNMMYVRQLIKYEINEWVEDRKEGMLPDRDNLIELLEDLNLVEECIGGLHKNIKQCETGASR